MLVNNVTSYIPHRSINKIVEMTGKYRNSTIKITQFFKGGKQVERHMEVHSPQGARHNVKVRQPDGTFKAWG